MTLYLASDHAGFELKEKVKKFLADSGYEVKDFGADTMNSEDDYPDFIRQAAEAVANDSNSRGIVFGGSGQGEAMVANRVKGIRAAVFYGNPSSAKASEGNDPFRIVKLSREHNDANVLSIGARFVSEREAKKAIKLWLETSFSNEERHRRRIAKF